MSNQHDGPRDLFPEDAERAVVLARLVEKARAEERARLSALASDAADSLLALMARITIAELCDLRDESDPVTRELNRAGEVYDAITAHIEGSGV